MDIINPELNDTSYLLNFAFLEVDDKSLLGAGGTCKVYKGKYKKEPVAVKIVYCTEITPKVLQNFCREAALHATLHHPNVVHMVGVCMLPPSVGIVLELCNMGSLYDLIHGPQWGRLTHADRLTLAVGCARGLAYLHNMRIVHLDVKSMNYLVHRVEAEVEEPIGVGVQQRHGRQEQRQEREEGQGQEGQEGQQQRRRQQERPPRQRRHLPPRPPPLNLPPGSVGGGSARGTRGSGRGVVCAPSATQSLNSDGDESSTTESNDDVSGGLGGLAGSSRVGSSGSFGRMLLGGSGGSGGGGGADTSGRHRMPDGGGDSSPRSAASSCASSTHTSLSHQYHYQVKLADLELSRRALPPLPEDGMDLAQERSFSQSFSASFAAANSFGTGGSGGYGYGDRPTGYGDEDGNTIEQDGLETTSGQRGSVATDKYVDGVSITDIATAAARISEGNYGEGDDDSASDVAHSYAEDRSGGLRERLGVGVGQSPPRRPKQVRLKSPSPTKGGPDSSASDAAATGGGSSMHTEREREQRQQSGAEDHEGTEGGEEEALMRSGRVELTIAEEGREENEEDEEARKDHWQRGDAGDYGDDGGDMEWDDARSDSVASTTSAASAGVRGLLLESAEPTRDARQNGARNNPLFKGSRDNSVDRHGYISDPDSERSEPSLPGSQRSHTSNVSMSDRSNRSLQASMSSMSHLAATVADSISDGLAAIKNSTSGRKRQRSWDGLGPETVNWTAPEVMRISLASYEIPSARRADRSFSYFASTGQISDKSDVYSLAMVLFEVFTGTVPFAHVVHRDDAEAMQIMNSGKCRPHIPSYVDEEIRVLLQTMWAKNPRSRPTAARVCAKLERLAEKAGAVLPAGGSGRGY